VKSLYCTANDANLRAIPLLYAVFYITYTTRERFKDKTCEAFLARTCLTLQLNKYYLSNAIKRLY